MSCAAGLLRQLQILGIELRAVSGQLAFRPANRVTAELRAEIAANKPGLLRLLCDDAALGTPVASSLGGIYLTARGSGSCFACRGVIYWRLEPDGEPMCAICHPPGPPPERIKWQRGRIHG